MDKVVGINFIDKKWTSLNDFDDSYTYIFQVYDRYELDDDIIDVISFVLTKEIVDNNPYHKIVCICFMYPYVVTFIKYGSPLEQFDPHLFGEDVTKLATELSEKRDKQKSGDYGILILNSATGWSIRDENIYSFRKRIKIDLEISGLSVYYRIGNIMLTGTESLFLEGAIL